MWHVKEKNTLTCNINIIKPDALIRSHHNSTYGQNFLNIIKTLPVHMLNEHNSSDFNASSRFVTITFKLPRSSAVIVCTLTNPLFFVRNFAVVFFYTLQIPYLL